MIQAVSSESESSAAVLPYPEPGGRQFTAGHSGSETSRERAVNEARGKVVQRRQQQALALLRVQGEHGLTVADLREITGQHHGQASSTLSTLHQRGIIERLTERRDKCLIYVLPEYVGQRQTSPYRKNRRDLSEQESEIQRLRAENALLRDRLDAATGRVRRVRELCNLRREQGHGSTLISDVEAMIRG